MLGGAFHLRSTKACCQEMGGHARRGIPSQVKQGMLHSYFFIQPKFYKLINTSILPHLSNHRGVARIVSELLTQSSSCLKWHIRLPQESATAAGLWPVW